MCRLPPATNEQDRRLCTLTADPGYMPRSDVTVTILCNLGRRTRISGGAACPGVGPQRKSRRPPGGVAPRPGVAKARSLEGGPALAHARPPLVHGRTASRLVAEDPPGDVPRELGVSFEGMSAGAEHCGFQILTRGRGTEGGESAANASSSSAPRATPRPFTISCAGWSTRPARWTRESCTRRKPSSSSPSVPEASPPPRTTARKSTPTPSSAGPSTSGGRRDVAHGAKEPWEVLI